MSAKRFRASLRAEVETAGNKLAGHAAVFDRTADIDGWFFERLDSACFNSALQDPETDCRALWNHNPDHLLGRQSSGTLRVGTDSTGLEFEIDLPNTTVGNDLRELASRGDVTEMSFGFIQGDYEVYEDEETGREVIVQTRVDALLDVSPVTWPAYGGTDVALRSLNLGSLRRKEGPPTGAPDSTMRDRAAALRVVRSRLLIARHSASIRKG